VGNESSVDDKGSIEYYILQKGIHGKLPFENPRIFQTKQNFRKYKSNISETFVTAYYLRVSLFQLIAHFPTSL
jgi:hypothetical protein